MAEQRIVLGFTGLDFSTAFDAVTTGKLGFTVKDLPQNSDRHALLLGMLTKKQLVISLDDSGNLAVAIHRKE